MYTETPQNFVQLQPWITCEKAAFSKCLTAGNPVFFYDTCAFIKHANFTNPEPLFLYLKQCNALVVITRCILMELTSVSETLQSEYISYIRKLHESGISVAVLYEEDLFSMLEQCFSSSHMLNQYLACATVHINSSVRTVSSIIKKDTKLFQILVRNQTVDHSVYRYFFQTVRRNKEPQDNLGEELLTICVHALSNLPNCQDCRFHIFTEDKEAIRHIEKALLNSKYHLHKTCFTALSTPRLIQRLYSIRLINTQSQIEDFLSTGNASSLIKVFASDNNNLFPELVTLPASELAKKIITPDAIHINY